jgi:hypothetical protein
MKRISSFFREYLPLSLCTVSLSIALILTAYQAWVLNIYIDALVTGHWDYFSRIFSIEPPARGPYKFCFGRCAPKLPFTAGWAALIFYATAVIILYWQLARSVKQFFNESRA